MTGVVQLLNALEQGDPHAAGRLLPLVYTEARCMSLPSLQPDLLFVVSAPREALP
jgi:hypothetical protein